jgi:tRNA G37 N-methylase TrmD
VSVAAIILCVASQRVFIVVVYFVMGLVRKVLDTPSYKAMTVVRTTTLVPKFCRSGKGKGKAVPVLLVTQHHAMKAHWRSACIAPLIL